MPARKRMEKLTAVKVAEIKRLLAAGVPSVVIANKFAISKQHVCDIKKGRSWPEVEPAHE